MDVSKTPVRQWGNSLAIRLPKSEVERFGLADGSMLELISEPTQIVLRPTVKQPTYTLDELLAKVTDENIHSEVDWGPAVGKEQLSARDS